MKGADGRNSSIVDKAAIQRGELTLREIVTQIPQKFEIYSKFEAFNWSCKVGTEVRCRRIL